MRNQTSRSTVRLSSIGSVTVLVVLGCSPYARAYNPKSPEVVGMIARGIAFLESDAASDHRLGAKALVGMSLLKHGAKPDHPKVIEAAGAIKKVISAANARTPIDADIYTVGLSIIFLITLDSSKYHSEIEELLDCLDVRQKEHGGWGYPNKKTGDTSMTQYGVLSSWEALQAGFDVAPESIGGVTIWLLKTQDPSGAFGYQGKVSEDFEPVKQSEVRPSMAVAGLGSVYICADLLDMNAPAKKKGGLPPAVKEVRPAGRRAPGVKIDPILVRRVQARGDRWVRDNFQINPPQWTHYYLYALERYHSFREASRGGATKEPRWYNEGVEFLLDSQAKDGSWRSNGHQTVDTAFSVLFLMRSTKTRIERARSLDDGTLVGGRGLPTETDRVEVRDGKVTAKAPGGLAESLLAALKKPSGLREPGVMEGLVKLPEDESRALISKHASKLCELARDGSAKSRRAAVLALVRSGNLDHVPTLIYALTDPEPAVAREARDGLRRLSRKFDGFSLPNNPTEEQIRRAVDDWKAWYLAIRPDTQFED